MRREIWSSGSMICVSKASHQDFLPLFLRAAGHTQCVCISWSVVGFEGMVCVKSSLGLSSGRGSGMMSSLSSSGTRVRNDVEVMTSQISSRSLGNWLIGAKMAPFSDFDLDYELTLSSNVVLSYSTLSLHLLLPW